MLGYSITSHYTSIAYRALLAERGITVSMSGKGACWDHARMELVWATRNGDCSDRYVFASQQEARTAIVDYLEVFSNRQRLHSSLGSPRPAHFAQVLASSDSVPTPCKLDHVRY